MIFQKQENRTERGRLRLLAAVATLGFGLAGCDREPALPVSKGAHFPPFDLPALDGSRRTSSLYAGKPLLINFWATWCPPCRREMADLGELYRALSPRGLELLAISVDADENLVKEFALREHLNFPVLLDKEQRWSLPNLAVPGFPTTYLVRRDGIIAEIIVGPRTWAMAETQARIAEQLDLG